MDGSVKSGLKAFGVAVLISGAFLFCIFVLPIALTLHGWRHQMAIGGKYMDSLTEKDFEAWKSRTQKYLAEFNPKNSEIDAVPVPTELKQLKIIGIDEGTNWIRYVWMGGMDHTALIVTRMEDGSFEFTARYNDASARTIKTIRPKTTETNLP